METRKLQEVGGGTFTVSIPRAWAENNGFEVGMELQLYTHRDGSILVDLRIQTSTVWTRQRSKLLVKVLKPSVVRFTRLTRSGSKQ